MLYIRQVIVTLNPELVWSLLETIQRTIRRTIPETIPGTIAATIPGTIAATQPDQIVTPDGDFASFLRSRLSNIKNMDV